MSEDKFGDDLQISSFCVVEFICPAVIKSCNLFPVLPASLLFCYKYVCFKYVFRRHFKKCSSGLFEDIKTLNLRLHVKATASTGQVFLRLAVYRKKTVVVSRKTLKL